MIFICVVSAMFLVPTALAQPSEEAPGEHAKESVEPITCEYLLVRAIVTEHAALDHSKRKKYGIEHLDIWIRGECNYEKTRTDGDEDEKSVCRIIEMCSAVQMTVSYCLAQHPIALIERGCNGDSSH